MRNLFQHTFKYVFPGQNKGKSKPSSLPCENLRCLQLPCKWTDSSSKTERRMCVYVCVYTPATPLGSTPEELHQHATEVLAHPCVLLYYS